MMSGYDIRLQPATLLKLTLLHGCFSRFLNCTNGTKSRNATHIVFKVSHVSQAFTTYILQSGNIKEEKKLLKKKNLLHLSFKVVNESKEKEVIVFRECSEAA